MKIDPVYFVLLLLFCTLAVVGSLGSPFIIPVGGFSLLFLAASLAALRSSSRGFYLLCLGIPVVFTVFLSSIVASWGSMIVLACILLRSAGLFHRREDLPGVLAFSGISLLLWAATPYLIPGVATLIAVVALAGAGILLLTMADKRVRRFCREGN